MVAFRRVLFLVTFVCLLVMGLAPCVSRADGEKVILTVMIYMIGSDLEENYSLASNDIQEMLGADIDSTQAKVLVYMSGAPNWLSIPDLETNNLFSVDEGKLKHLESVPQQNMGDALTLSDFLIKAQSYAPAEKYALVMWDHGQGPIIGYGKDIRFNNDALTILEMQEALRMGGFLGLNRLAWIAFDACQMASLETSFAIKDFANYLIASQSDIPSEGLDYAFLKVLPGKTVQDVYTEMEDLYFAYNKNKVERANLPKAYLPDISLSLLDLTQIDPVLSGLNELASRLSAGQAQGNFSSYVRTRSEMNAFGRYMPGRSYDTVDINEMISYYQGIYPDEVYPLIEALTAFVTDNRAFIDQAGGVSIYYPSFMGRDFLGAALDLYDKLDFLPAYQGFLKDYRMIATSKSYVDWTLSKPNQEADKHVASMQLTSEQLSNFESASFAIVAQGNQPHEYYVIKTCKVPAPDTNGLLVFNYDETSIFLRTVDDELAFMNFTETSRTNDLAYGYARIILQNFEDVDNWFNGIINIGIVIDLANRNAYITNSLLEGDDESELSNGKMEVIFKPRDLIVTGTMSSFVESFDSNGNLLPVSQWKANGIIRANELYYEEMQGLELQSINNIDMPLFGQFIIHDTRGNQYGTNLIHLSDKSAGAIVQNNTEEPAASRTDNEMLLFDSSSEATKNLTLLEQDGVKIELLDIDTDEQRYSSTKEMRLALRITNQHNSEKPIKLQVDKVYINNIDIDGYIYSDWINAKDTVVTELWFTTTDVFRWSNITKISRFLLAYKLQNDDYATLLEGHLAFKTNVELPENFIPRLDEVYSRFSDSEFILQNAIIKPMFVFRKALNYKMIFQIENTTEHWMNYNIGRLYLDGFMFYSSQYIKLPPLGIGYLNVSIDEYNIDKAGIREKDNIARFFTIGFSLYGVENDTMTHTTDLTFAPLGAVDTSFVKPLITLVDNDNYVLNILNKNDIVLTTTGVGRFIDDDVVELQITNNTNMLISFNLDYTLNGNSKIRGSAVTNEVLPGKSYGFYIDNAVEKLEKYGYNTFNSVQGSIRVYNVYARQLLFDESFSFDIEE